MSENFQQLVFEQLREITLEVKHIQKILARLDNISEAQKRLEQRDEAQQRAIDGLQTKNGEFVISLTMVLNDVKQMLKDIDLLKVSLSPLGKLVDKVSVFDSQLDRLEREVVDTERKAKYDQNVNEMTEWRPLLKSLRWFLIIAGGILATAVVGAILWAMQQSGVLAP